MTKTYVAHPFGGLDENRIKVEAIILKLLKANPDTLYISPIHATGFYYHDVSYTEGMARGGRFKVCYPSQTKLKGAIDCLTKDITG